MKKFLILSLMSAVFIGTGCKDADDEANDPSYTITIMSPNSDDKNVDDNIHLHINFESQTNKTIHHIKVRIYDKASGTEIYNKPGDAHIHEESGYFEWHDDFELNNANGVIAHTDWILEAKVWGHDAGVAEVIEMVEFHVHP